MLFWEIGVIKSKENPNDLYILHFESIKLIKIVIVLFQLIIDADVDFTGAQSRHVNILKREIRSRLGCC